MRAISPKAFYRILKEVGRCHKLPPQPPLPYLITNYMYIYPFPSKEIEEGV